MHLLLPLFTFLTWIFLVLSSSQSSGSIQNTRPGLKEALMENTTDVFDAKFLSLFIADAFAPKEYDGASTFEINQKFLSALEASKSALLSIGISQHDISILETCLNKIQFKNNGIEDQEKNIWERIKSLKLSTRFDGTEDSVILISGVPKHACLCEIIKLKLNKDNQIDQICGIVKIVFLIYNSGNGISF